MNTAHEYMNIKNKVGISSLNYQLSQIDKANKAELRMHNNVKQRFRAKYGVTDHKPTNVGKNDICMYRTHNPGFCYHRDGQQRMSDIVVPPAQRPDYQEILNLLFTNGELDTKKVLCLHVLASHPCESLKPPARSHRALSFLAKEQSPLEKLIERSRSRKDPDLGRLNTLLPTYVLNLNQKENKPSAGYNQKRYSNDCCIRDGRLATRLVINENITRLVQAVLEALQRSNPEKMSHLLKTAHNPDKMKEIMSKPEIQDFLNSLTGHSMISSSDSFHLTRPFKTSVPLAVDQPTSSLEKLVKEIRRNVLKVPNTSSKRLQEKFRNDSLASPSITSEVKDKENVNPDECCSSSLSGATCNFDVERLAFMLNTKVREAHERDVRELKKSMSLKPAEEYFEKRARPSTPSTDTTDNDRPSSVDTDNNHERCERNRGLRNSCIACRQRWRQEMFPTKFPTRTSNFSGINKDILRSITTRSTHMISMMIKQELDKMERQELARKREKEEKQKQITRRSVNNQPSNQSESFRRSSYLSRKAKNYAQYYGYKANVSSQVVNNLNLAKIKHEISVKENSKRVKKFLDEPLFDQPSTSKANE